MAAKVLKRGTPRVVNRAATALRLAAWSLIRSRSALGAKSLRPSLTIDSGRMTLVFYRCDLKVACYRGERTSSRAGVAPAEGQRLSRRTITSTIGIVSGEPTTPEQIATQRALSEVYFTLHVDNRRQVPAGGRPK